jgi:hypothetical protein
MRVDSIPSAVADPSRRRGQAGEAAASGKKSDRDHPPVPRAGTERNARRKFYPSRQQPQQGSFSERVPQASEQQFSPSRARDSPSCGPVSRPCRQLADRRSPFPAAAGVTVTAGTVAGNRQLALHPQGLPDRCDGGARLQSLSCIGVNPVELSTTAGRYPQR